ncbi:unnamed protein product [Chondrus crispus]|uniref:Uncharacterized protein n=1 Tax=Chondrus crispus TaxID=2769 RepID=R7QLB4_CHOCR|nr:unnamed protein product [Chondrus crispus]CDF38543.1 unnamed protein product [Chondrus crispus]|eukprot:XP_005718436.1 unnamed protein product [Chondrus crispus]
MLFLGLRAPLKNPFYVLLYHTCHVPCGNNERTSRLILRIPRRL